MKELSKTYDPKQVEDQIYKLWLQSKAFQPKVDPNQKPFVITIPPPNVTGSLHMGHALNNVIQDILIRRARMKGIPSLWVPGTDHAGIATQNVVEKQLAKKGKNKQDLGRVEFEKEILNWVDEYGHIIIDQLKKLGCSCDWSRQRFTLDKEYSEAVNSAFEHYYKKGWIYQGERVINWCVHCQTALSDIEVEHKSQEGKLYYFRYDKDFPITIATTRPETKLGDTAVAVNPRDKRYQKFIGKSFSIDFLGVERKIKVITDENIDPEFGTGALGVTPAHSLIDAEIARKNDMESIQVIDKYGRMTDKAGKDFKGLKAKEAAEKIITQLKERGLLEKTDDIENNLSTCYRCHHILEPQPSKQWFLKMSELIKPAIEAVKNGEIKFVPKRWEKVYLDWMENLNDWCISRQIWWGHRLPVWQSEVKSKMSKGKTDYYIGDNPPADYKQVDDVLDTWFSSALWPMAVLGWPKKTKDLEYFYPTSVLSTARDIIYLWVARMIFSGFEFTKEKPFQTVYIHPTIFNIEGKRMSKSLGTGIDPLDSIEKYGTDATRFGLTYINTGIQDIKFDENAILAGQKFANKIWNISRFVMMSLESSKLKAQSSNEALNPKTEADKKILNSLDSLINSVNLDLDSFRFGQVAHNLYDFIWHDFADIYLEKSKEQLEDEKLRENTQDVLLYTLTNSLKLLHPIMPFITEEIWQKLLEEGIVKENLITAQWTK